MNLLAVARDAVRRYLPAPARGYLYLSMGSAEVREMTLLSLRTLRESGNGEPVTVVTDEPDPRLVPFGVTFHTVPARAGYGGGSRFWKTRMASLSFYEHTLFLDSDTLILGPLAELWEAFTASACPVALSLAGIPTVGEAARLMPYLVADIRVTHGVCPPGFPHWNTGIMLWKRGAAADRLFRRWHGEWLKTGEVDQFALARALHAAPVDVHPLDPLAYNRHPFRHRPLLFSRDQASRDPAVRIVHLYGYGVPWKLRFMRGETFDIEAYSQLLPRTAPKLVEEATAS